MRCSTTGRKCDGYKPPPPGWYSWEHLLSVRPPPSLAPDADTTELRGLDFFRQVVAPTMCGPFDRSFWTHFVTQVVHQEPAAKYAVLSLSSLFERLRDINTQEWPVKSKHNSLAIRHYNTAIRHVVILPTATPLDIILLVCVIFTSIEVFQGNNAAAMNHCKHAIRILNSTKFNSSSELAPIFRHLSIFPFFFGGGIDTWPLPHDNFRQEEDYTKRLTKAQGSLNCLLSRTGRLVRASGQFRLGVAPQCSPPPHAVNERERLDVGLDAWYKANEDFQAKENSSPANEVKYLVLEMRWLVCKIWVNTCLDQQETSFDAYWDQFRRIVDFAARANTCDRVPSTEALQSTFQVGLCPLLYFVITKCRDVSLRLEALSLLKSLSSESESLWDSATMCAIGRRTIEIEHGVQLDVNDAIPTVDLSNVVESFPQDEMRVRDFAWEQENGQPFVEGGVKRLRRKICFFIGCPKNGVKSVYEYITVR